MNLSRSSNSVSSTTGTLSLARVAPTPKTTRRDTAPKSSPEVAVLPAVETSTETRRLVGRFRLSVTRAGTLPASLASVTDIRSAGTGTAGRPEAPSVVKQ